MKSADYYSKDRRIMIHRLLIHQTREGGLSNCREPFPSRSERGHSLGCARLSQPGGDIPEQALVGGVWLNYSMSVQVIHEYQIRGMV